MGMVKIENIAGKNFTNSMEEIFSEKDRIADR
jgi:hypothetical protein